MWLLSLLIVVIYSLFSLTNGDLDLRIVGGIATTIDKHPYIVQLRDQYDEAFCGGTIIKPRFVITAGHCFDHKNYRNTFVVGGTGKLKGEGVKRKIKKATVHPEYNPRDFISDLAVVELAEPMEGKYIQPVPLCDQPLRAGNVLQVSGWGTLSENAQHMASQLHTVRLPVSRMSTCRKEFGRLVKKNMFCTSLMLAKGHCYGDSGGPAMFKQQLCGITSFGDKCGMVGYQSAYTSIYPLRRFINNVIAKSNQ